MEQNNLLQGKVQIRIYPEWNFGKSKGLSFDNVLIYPTQKIIKFLKNGDPKIIETIRAKFYVAVTRARYNVGIVFDTDDFQENLGLVRYE